MIWNVWDMTCMEMIGSELNGLFQSFEREFVSEEDDDFVEVEVSKYPLDASALKKGDVITIGQIEMLTGVSRTHEQFRIAGLNLRNFIRRELAAIDLHVSMRLTIDGLVILTDAQAVPYTIRRVKNSIRAAVRANSDLGRVDGANLTADLQKLRDDKHIRYSRILQAAAKEARRALPEPEPYQRKTPGLPSPESPSDEIPNKPR